MLLTESLPSQGQGSFQWWETVFNHKKELNRVLSGIALGCGIKPAMDWFGREVTSLLTEKAAGETALTIQQPTHYLIEKNNHKLSVIEIHLSEYGNLYGDYLKCDDSTTPEIKVGLDKSFNLLSEIKPDEGVVTFSPSALYKTSGSRSDVVNILIVKERDDNKTIVEGHYLFLNQEISDEERQYWIQLHTADNQKRDSSPAGIVSDPQLLGVSIDGKPLNIQEYIDWMNMAFMSQFGKPLFAKDHDVAMEKNIFQKVAENIHQLFDVLINQGAYSLYLSLWKMIETNQEQWAIYNNIDPYVHWQAIVMGEKLLMGFHPAGDSDDFSDIDSILSNDFEAPNHCKIHGRFRGHRCPKCNK